MVWSKSTVREDLEEDEMALQKIQESAVAVKLRGGKKRGRDVALSDSESEDEEYRRLQSKKRRVAGDKLEDLGTFSTPVCFHTTHAAITPAHDDETKAFYAAYQNGLEDQDDGLEHLNIVHDHLPGIEDAADPLGDDDMDIGMRDVGMSDFHVEHHPSPETRLGVGFPPLSGGKSAHPNSHLERFRFGPLCG